MFKRFMILNAAEADLLGGGGGANPAPANPAPANPAPANPAPANPAPAKITIPENWKESLDADILNDPSIKSIKDVNALAKSFIHGQKLVGKDKIVVPDHLTSDEEWGKIYQKLGMPETADKYSFKAPDGTDPEFAKEFSAFAHKNGILPKQAEHLFNWYGQKAAAISQSQEEAGKASFSQTVDGLKKEWGSAYDRKLSNASGLFKQFADADTVKYMRDTGFSNDPKVLRLMAKIADSFGEDKFVSPGGDGGTGLTPADAQAKIIEIQGNPNHAYYHKTHPGNAQARLDMAKYHAAVVAGKKR